jgi:hypothetical protein
MMKNRMPWIITAAIIIIVIFFMYFWMSGTFPKGMTGSEKNSVNFTPEFIDTDLSLNKLPLEIRHEVLIIDNSFTLTKWEFNSTNNNVINLYAPDIRNENEIKGLQGKKIGNYTFYVIRDREFEISRAEVEAYIMELEKNPDYQIGSSEMVQDPNGPYAIVWCYRSTPGNKKLDNTVIKGWKILVYTESLPPQNSSMK